MLDEKEFLSPMASGRFPDITWIIPIVCNVHGEEYRVDYLPAESKTGMFGGNSNWRGPIWFPVNALIFRALLVLYSYYGNEFTVECPSGSGNEMNLFQIASELANRLSSIFLCDQRRHVPFMEEMKNFKQIHTGANIFSFMNISMVIMVRGLERVIKPVRPDWLQN